MQIKSAVFIKSSPGADLCPQDNRPEFAFIGRSNVGKSSLVNMLVSRKGLAQISSTPGKTKLINHYLINEAWYLVDLPGYGYAKTAKSFRDKFDKMLRNYLSQRKQLVNTFLLIDSRHEPILSDLEFMEWLGVSQIPFTIVFTKTDKSGKTELQRTMSRYKKRLLEFWEELPPIIMSSSETNQGRKEILEMIDEQLN